MLAIPVNHDHMITQSVNKDLLILKCTHNLKILSFHFQMADLSVSICVKVQNDDYGIEWLLDVSSPMFVPRQLRFSLYSGAVITEGWV